MPRPRVSGTVTKTPDETRIFNLTFVDFLATGETLVSQNGSTEIVNFDTATTPIVVDSITFSGAVAQLTVSSGSVETRGESRFLVEFSVNTSLGVPQVLDGAIMICVQADRTINFLVQNDSGTIENANAYITVATFLSYHRDRGGDLCPQEDTEIQAAIIRATDYLDQRFRFVGERLNTDQRTKWPRIDAEDFEGRVRFGIPYEIADACAEYAFISLTSTLNPTPDRDSTGRGVKETEDRVGPIEEKVEFVDGGVFEMPKYPIADDRLRQSGLTITGIDLVRA